MRIKRVGNELCIWLTARETYNWATRPNQLWPCSELKDKPVFARFASNGDLVGFHVNYGKGEQDAPADEFDALMNYYLGPVEQRKSRWKLDQS